MSMGFIFVDLFGLVNYILMPEIGLLVCSLVEIQVSWYSFYIVQWMVNFSFYKILSSRWLKIELPNSSSSTPIPNPNTHLSRLPLLNAWTKNSQPPDLPIFQYPPAINENPVANWPRSNQVPLSTVKKNLMSSVSKLKLTLASTSTTRPVSASIWEAGK
jgi:hypothetical protein